VGNLRETVNLEPIDCLLHRPICVGHPSVLAQMFSPTVQHERFDEETIMLWVLEYFPGKRAVTTTLTCQMANGL
jgi:hypothetical protein